MVKRAHHVHHHSSMKPCHSCSGSGWLTDAARSVARHAIPAAAGLAFGPGGAAVARGAVEMAGFGHHEMDGAGKMVKVRAADGKEMRVKKLFTRDGKPVEVVRAQRQAAPWLKERNAAVRKLMLEEGLSLAQASAELKERPDLWQRR